MKVDLKPWAAYVIGHDSRIVRLRQVEYAMEPHDDDVDVGVPRTVSKLRAAARQVVREMGSVYGPFTASLDGLLRVNQLVPDRLSDGCAAADIGVAEYRETRELADQALPRDHTLHRWEDLGAVLGRLEIQAYEAADGVAALPPLPSLHEVTQCIRGFPLGSLTGIPILSRWLREADTAERLGAVRFLREIEAYPGLENRTGETPGPFDAFYVMMALRGVDGQIEQSLRRLAPSVGNEPERSETEKVVDRVVVPIEESPRLPEPLTRHEVTEPAVERGRPLQFGLILGDDNVAWRPGHESVAFDGNVRSWDLFEVLARPANVHRNADIWREVWGEIEIESNSYHSAISKLRKLLGRLGLDIQGVRNVGYRLIELKTVLDGG